FVEHSLNIFCRQGTTVSETRFSALYRLAPHFQGFFAPLKTCSLVAGNNKLLLKCSGEHLKHATECLKHAPEQLKRSADKLEYKNG
ncbi:hypothetical protein, partial [Sunxiuqinia dokdonensis]|uniref:hypothetical protein n=1 Tax=Sunxiuqinia dokdonensis TaxID=1409788 RepID=UPI001955AA93